MSPIPFPELIAPAIAGLASAALARTFLSAGLLPDRPNERSLHSKPVSRSGGIGLMSGVVLGSILSGGVLAAMWLAAGLAIASVADDRWSLPAFLRLVLHFVAVIAFLYLARPWPSNMSWPLVALGLAWMTNLYNFMDGADGLAGGMAVVGFGAFAVAAAVNGGATLFLPCLCIAAAAAGFLVFNFPPARIFMGDAGSVPLGFLAGAVGLSGWRDGLWPAVFPLLAFAPFIADASVTLLRRAWRREKVWQPHRQHYYQRLILGGWSHRRLAIGEYLVMLGCAAAALSLLWAPPAARMWVPLVVASALVGLMVAVDRRYGATPKADHA